MKTPKRILKIYPASRYLYFEVWIWKHKKDMVEHLRMTGMKGSADACCQSIRRIDCNAGKLLAHIGTIHFHEKYMPYPVIIHEFGHAAIEWGRRKKLSIDMNLETTWITASEEMILHAQCDMLYQFWNKLEKSQKDSGVL